MSMRRRAAVLLIVVVAAAGCGRARVKQGADEFGGDHAIVKTLPLHGHLDVLVGRLASSEVFEPIRRWLIGPR